MRKAGTCTPSWIRSFDTTAASKTDDLARILYRGARAHDRSVPVIDSSPRLKPGAVEAGLPVPTGGLAEAGPRRRRGLHGRRP